MTFDPPKHNRQSLRWPGYDYHEPGAYYITVCCQHRFLLFGEIVDGVMRLNEFGRVVDEIWRGLPRHYQRLEVDQFVVMPNHLHGIVILSPEWTKAGLSPAPTPLSEVVRALKSFSAREINRLRNSPGVPVWQRNYYDHVMRDDEDLNRIREYILDNPANWGKDENNPESWK